MGDFFKPWRRKFGVVTLVLALAAMGVWIRSLAVMDSFVFPLGSAAIAEAGSIDGHFAWYIDQRVNSTTTAAFPEWDTVEFTNIDELFDSPMSWQWRWWGFAAIQYQSDQQMLWVVPYWSIVVPFTLLSAYLLLARTRKQICPTPPDS